MGQKISYSNNKIGGSVQKISYSGTYTYAITSGSLPAGLSLAGNAISGTPMVDGSFSFTVTATDNSAAPGPYSGPRAYTLVLVAPAVTAVTWTGSVSTDWYTAGNWMLSTVPTATIDTIPTSPSGGCFPAITAGTAQVRSLTVNSGATLTHTGGQLTGSLTNNSTFQPTGGTVTHQLDLRALATGVYALRLSTSAGVVVKKLVVE